MIFDYYSFNESKKVNTTKLTYAIAGKAWNVLWEKHKFNFKDIVIQMKYIKDDELGIFEVFVYTEKDDTKGIYETGFKSRGVKAFHGIDEERKLFFNWLKDIGILIE